MVETKFTKGPWRIDDCGDVRSIESDEVIAVVLSDTDELKTAYLIAAAPEMYEGIEAAIDELKALELITSLDGFSYITTPIVIKKLESILAKARGDSK